MRYAEFRDQIEAALRQESLFFTGADESWPSGAATTISNFTRGATLME